MIGRVADLPAEVRQVLGDRDLIVFDGECVLCSGFFRFMLKKDRKERFSFALAQSELGEQIYAALGLNTRDFETNVVIVNGCIYGQLGAFAAAMSAIGLPWRALGVISVVPHRIGDQIYHLIARNRYRIFGRYDTCLLPSPETRSRFIDTGWAAAA